MNGVIEQLKKAIRWEYFPFLVFAFLMGLLHLFMHSFRDDLVYAEILSKRPIITLLFDEYYHWTSRLLIEVVSIIFTKYEFVYFSIVDTIIYFLLPYMISKLFVSKNKYECNWVIVFLLLCVPFITMLSTAGWIITSINYLWPLTFGLIAMYPIKKIYFNEQIRWYENILYFIATLFAANMEIMAAIIMVFYLIASIFFFIKKKNNWLIIFLTICLIGNIIFILTCPGNAVRDLAEATARFPEFINLNFFDKLALSATSSLITIDLNLIAFVVSGMALFFIWKRYKTIIPRIMGVMPFMFIILIILSRVVILGQKCTRLCSDLTGKECIYPIDYWKLVNVTPEFIHYILLFAFGILAVFFMLMTLVLFKNSSSKWIAFLVMGAGIMSRVVVGFSPTVYISGARTFLFLYIALAIVGLLIYRTFSSILTPDKKRRLFKCLCVFAVLGYLQSWLYLFYINICLV